MDKVSAEDNYIVRSREKKKKFEQTKKTIKSIIVIILKKRKLRAPQEALISPLVTQLQ